MSLTNELQEAINKNLPSMMRAELVKRLEQADEDKRKVEQLTHSNQSLLGDFRLAQAEADALRADLKKHEKLAVREAAVAEAERGLEVRMLKHQLEVSDDNVKFARDVAMGLVRNTEFKRDVFTTQNNRAIPVPQGGTVMQSYSNETSAISTREEAK